MQSKSLALGVVAFMVLGSVASPVLGAKLAPAVEAKNKSSDGVAQSMDGSAKRMVALRADLDLTLEQFNSISTLADKGAKHLGSSGEVLRKNRAELDRVLYQVNPDFESADKIKTILNDLDRERIEHKIRFVSEMKNILNQDQFAKWIVKFYPAQTKSNAPEAKIETK